jgi:integrase
VDTASTGGYNVPRATVVTRKAPKGFFYREGSDILHFSYQQKLPNGKSKQVRVSTETADIELAKDFKKKTVGESWRVKKLGEPNKTWEDACIRFLEEKKSKKIVKKYACQIQWLTDQAGFSGLKLRNISADFIWQTIENKQRGGNQYIKRPLADATKDSYYLVIKLVLECAKQWSWLEEVPRIRFHRTDNARQFDIDSRQIDKLLDNLPFHLRGAAIFGMVTGARRSNVLGLKWSQVDLERRIITFHKVIMKNGRPWSVPIGEAIEDVLNAFMGLHDEYVFVYRRSQNERRPKGSRPVGWGRWLPFHSFSFYTWREACRKAGLPDNFTWHGLRHAFASMAAPFITTKLLQDAGGWRSDSMVNRYTHLNVEAKRPVAALMDKLMDGSVKHKLRRSADKTAPEVDPKP